MRPAAWRCGGGGGVGDGDPPPAAVAADRASAAGCGEHCVDPPMRPHRLSGSGPATCRRSAERALLLQPVQPGDDGLGGVD